MELLAEFGVTLGVDVGDVWDGRDVKVGDQHHDGVVSVDTRVDGWVLVGEEVESPKIVVNLDIHFGSNLQNLLELTANDPLGESAGFEVFGLHLVFSTGDESICGHGADQMAKLV